MLFLLLFFGKLCVLRLSLFLRIYISFSGTWQCLVDILAGIENYACDVTLLAKFSQLLCVPLTS